MADISLEVTGVRIDGFTYDIVTETGNLHGGGVTPVVASHWNDGKVQTSVDGKLDENSMGRLLFTTYTKPECLTALRKLKDKFEKGETFEAVVTARGSDRDYVLTNATLVSEVSITAEKKLEVVIHGNPVGGLTGV